MSIYVSSLLSRFNIFSLTRFDTQGFPTKKSFVICLTLI
jgi:hypothetical protein